MRPESCRGCPLDPIGTGWVPAFIPEGLPEIALMGVGEAPGATEATQGIPFVGRSGIFLDWLFRLAGLSRAEWAFHNALSCQPPGNVLRGAPYRDGALFQCRPNLEKAIERVNPKVLVAFGDTALERLTGKTGIQRYRGFWLIGPRGIPVMPTFHPAYLLPGRTKDELRKDRPSRFMGCVLWDLKRAAAQAKVPGPFRRMPQRYLIDPTPAVFRDWALGYRNVLANRGPEVMLTYDIETPGKAPKVEQQIPMLQQPIIRMGFAFTPGEAVTVLYRPDHIGLIRELLSTEGITTGWNSLDFDNPVLEFSLGGPFLRGPHADMMRAWHVLQSDLPKGLEFVASFFTDLFPWKDLKGVDEAAYNATDCDAQIRNSYGIRNAMTPRELDIFWRLVMGIAPFLREAGERGVPIDVAAQAQLQAELEVSLKKAFIDVQALVSPKFYKEKIYVRKPVDRTVAEVTVTRQVAVCSACGKEKPMAVHYRATKTRPPCEGAPLLEDRQVPGYRALMDLDPEKPFDYIQEEIAECGFNPLSIQQVAYYAGSFRHLDLLRASGSNVSSLDDTVLGQLIRRFGKTHPIYKAVREIREQSKKLSTYVIGYRPDDKGLIYTRFTDNPSTLRLASQDVNLQNVLEDIKKTIRAPLGWRFVEVDSAAIEALMVGLCAQSPSYVRLAAQGVHDFVLARALGIPWGPEALLVTKAKENKALRTVKKITVHLSNFGGTPKTMRQQSPDIYRTEGEAAAEQDYYFSVCPEIPAWQKRARLIASKTHIVENPWGFRQYFNEVFDSGRPGEDFNRCLGNGPQSMAGFVMRENLFRLKDSAWRQFAIGNCSIHDSLGLLVPDAVWEDAAEYLLTLMTRPIPELDNLRIGADAKVSANGGTWAEMLPHRTVRFDDPLALSTWHLGG